MSEEQKSLVNGTCSYSRTAKIRILNLVIEQMKLMVKENQKQINLGNDVEDRQHLIEILQDEIRKNQLKIDKIMRGEKLKSNFFQRTGNDEEDI